MEELLPTDALERTLTDEAEAAADRLRMTAESEAQSLAAGYDQETEALVAEVRSGFARRADRIRVDLERSLPLGRRRLEAVFLEQALTQAFEDLALDLDEDLWRQVFGARLVAAVPALTDGGPVEVTISGWTEPGAGDWLGALVPGARIEVTPGNPGDRTLRAVGAGGRTIYRLSVPQLWDELRDTQREELVQALFPGRETHAGLR